MSSPAPVNECERLPRSGWGDQLRRLRPASSFQLFLIYKLFGVATNNADNRFNDYGINIVRNAISVTPTPEFIATDFYGKAIEQFCPKSYASNSLASQDNSQCPINAISTPRIVVRSRNKITLDFWRGVYNIVSRLSPTADGAIAIEQRLKLLYKKVFVLIKQASVYLKPGNCGFDMRHDQIIVMVPDPPDKNIFTLPNIDDLSPSSHKVNTRKRRQIAAIAHKHRRQIKRINGVKIHSSISKISSMVIRRPCFSDNHRDSLIKVHHFPPSVPLRRVVIDRRFIPSSFAISSIVIGWPVSGFTGVNSLLKRKVAFISSTVANKGIPPNLLRSSLLLQLLKIKRLNLIGQALDYATTPMPQ